MEFCTPPEKKTVHQCCVLNCYNTSDDDDDLSFHTFPTDPELRKTWLSIVPMRKKLCKRTRICCKHFNASDFTEVVPGFIKIRRRLRRNIIPSVNLPDKVQFEVPIEVPSYRKVVNEILNIEDLREKSTDSLTPKDTIIDNSSIIENSEPENIVVKIEQSFDDSALSDENYGIGDSEINSIQIKIEKINDEHSDSGIQSGNDVFDKARNGIMNEDGPSFTSFSDIHKGNIKTYKPNKRKIAPGEKKTKVEVPLEIKIESPSVTSSDTTDIDLKIESPERPDEELYNMPLSQRIRLLRKKKSSQRSYVVPIETIFLESEFDQKLISLNYEEDVFEPNTRLVKIQMDKPSLPSTSKRRKMPTIGTDYEDEMNAHLSLYSGEDEETRSFLSNAINSVFNKDRLTINTPSTDDNDFKAKESNSYDADSILLELANVKRETGDKSDEGPFNWSYDSTTFTGQRETFTGTPGPTFQLNENTKMVDVFYKMFDPGFIDMVCEETNKYGSQKVNFWKLVDRDELISFFALIILQDVEPRPYKGKSIQSYIDPNESFPLLGEIMSKNRYLTLLRMLNFVEESEITSELVEIAPVVQYFTQKFSKLYNPSQEMVVDKVRLKFDKLGKLVDEDYVPKTYDDLFTFDLCETSTGYLWNFDIQPVKNIRKKTKWCDDFDDEVFDEKPNFGNSLDIQCSSVSEGIVYKLVEPILHQGHTVVLNDIYSSPLLARQLKEVKTDSYGKLRLDRDYIPQSIKHLAIQNMMDLSGIRIGEAVATYSTDLSVIAWGDVNLLTYFSTYHKQNYNTLTSKPDVVKHYHKAMKNMNKRDYFLRVKNSALFRIMFERIFNAAVFNCFVMYSTKHSISEVDFRKELAQDLLNLHKPKISDPDLKSKYIPLHLQVRSVKNSHCNRCYQVHKKITTSYWQCNDCQLTLCNRGCFELHHKTLQETNLTFLNS